MDTHKSQPLKRYLIIDGTLLAVVGLACWLLGNRSWHAYGVGLVWLGIDCALVGLSSILGFWGMTQRYETQQGESVGDWNIHQRSAIQVQSSRRSYAFLLELFALGLPLFVIGSILETVFG